MIYTRLTNKNVSGYMYNAPHDNVSTLFIATLSIEQIFGQQ